MKKKNSKPKAKKASKSSPASKAPVVLIGERVLVRPLTEHEQGSATSFGIIIPDTVDKEKSEQGIVVAIGPGKRTEQGVLLPMTVKIGNKVLFNKYGFDEVKIAGKEYYIVSESNILAILN